MAEPAQGVESAVELAGYEPELKRTLGSFQMFAISFAFISVAVGIFATYDVVLQTGGPVSIWLWVLAAVGQVLVALVYAQFAARIPLSGSSYQWGSRLANPKIGFGLGWLTVCYLAIGVVATDDALAKTAFMPLFNIRPNELTARLITLVVLLIEVVVVVASTRLASMINSSAVALELVIVLGFSIALIIAVAVTGHGSEGNLVSRGVAPRSDYFAIGGGLMDAMILGLATLVGFDSAANLAEEAKDPFRSVPRAIVGSVVAAGVLGLVFLVALTVAIKSIPRVTDSDSPIATIIRDHFGSGTERIFLVAITLAFFGAAIAVMTACSRLGIRDVTRFTLPCSSAHAAGQFAHAYADTGDTPDLRRGGRPDGRAARGRAVEADHFRDDHHADHLRRDNCPLPSGAQATRSQGGRVQPGPVRIAGRDQRPVVGCVRPVRDHRAQGGVHP